MFTYLFSPFSRTGHPTPRPTPWVLSLLYKISVGYGGNSLKTRLWEIITSMKAPLLASPTQAETASGVCPTNLRISAGSSLMKSTKWSILHKLYEKFFYVLKNMFNYHLYLQLCTSTSRWCHIWSFELKFKVDLKSNYETWKTYYFFVSSLGRLNWKLLCRVMMVLSSTIAKFESALCREGKKRKKYLRCVSPKPMRPRALLASVLEKALRLAWSLCLWREWLSLSLIYWSAGSHPRAHV
jgi:hypothetical protein